jgi:hypothetical protein
MWEISPIIRQQLEAAGLTMECTCTAVPEQYELFKEGSPAGHIRVRWSRFTVDYPEAAEERLYDGVVDGFGAFSDREREECLSMAISLITQRMSSA